ncbi:MaoC family dehydratase [Sphingobium baderi]|uniref:Acyl dehydratase n=1 Tax=Sphingobium baderi TaxID=1332080 RepID=A0A0S3EV47_9SPHN|nr:MaoC family dehydratase [Sphingobium baderi]ALR19297.1 acyl dehydratase [Sphingobium baderi]
MSAFDSIPQLGRGAYWQELVVGQKGKTWRRTVTEADLVNFISATGMVEVLFTDATYQGAVKGRLVPGALTYSFIEGLIFQSAIQGVGLALLDVHMKVVAPVLVNDTIWAVLETTDIRPTSKGNRAIVKWDVTIYNQDEKVVMTYEVTRMVAGDPARA